MYSLKILGRTFENKIKAYEWEESVSIKLQYKEGFREMVYMNLYTY